MYICDWSSDVCSSDLVDAYEQFRQAQGLPATYQVVYAVLEKPL